MILAMMAAMAMKNWQDGILNVPYGGGGAAKLGIRLLRQDFENLGRGKNCMGGPLKIGTNTFDHGLGTHAVSHVRVVSPEPITRFSADVGVDNNGVTNPGSPIGSVSFAVNADRREVARTKTVMAGQEAVSIRLDLNDAHALDLLVEDGGNGTACDWADWGDATVTLKGGKTVRLDDVPMLEGGVGASYPFSFLYGGRESDEILPSWTTQRQTTKLDPGRTRITTSWTDPSSGMKLTWEVVRYGDFPALDWVLYLENIGSKDTLVVDDLQVLDVTLTEPLSRERPYVLHKTKGSVVNQHDFEPSEEVVGPRSTQVMAGGSGKSSAVWFPFFKVDRSKGALVLAVGWSGQWKATFACPDSKNLAMKAGQELTHFVLRPGERVRTPRILLLNHEGDTLDANSSFRALIRKHYMATRNGKVPEPIPFCNTCFTRGGLWLNECDAENQISLIKAYSKLGLEALLTDAGWFEGGWPAGAGNWTPRKDAYPNGMAPVAKAAKDHNMIYGLWFEPERVVAGTQFHREHPDWVLTNGVDGERTLLANFGLKEVQDHFFGIVKGFMDLPGFRVYRQDFNFFPMNWWRHNDAPDRQGITEMKYIEGLYAYWDRLSAAWPDALREECASGGMRIDLETVKRMHVHQKTDYWFDDDADQGHLFGLSQYLPNGVVVAHLNNLDEYSFRSTMASSLGLGWIADAKDFDFARGKKLLARYLELRHLLNGDWFPLLPHTLKPTEWMATQFNRPDLGEGMILAFRHAECAYPSAELRLRGLVGSATYEVKFESAGKAVRLKGSQLMKGLTLTIPSRRGSELATYRRL